MVVEALFIGLVIGFLYYEIVGISPGGVIAPGYIALFMKHPNKIVMTLVIALIVFGVLQLLSRYLVIYGRRKLLLALLLGFCCKLLIELYIQPISFISFDLQSIGYVIPGLIANEISRQKIVPTFLSLGIVSVIVYGILLLLAP